MKRAAPGAFQKCWVAKFNRKQYHSITITERAGLFNLGTREQTVTFIGNGIFTTDLSAFNGDNVIIDSYRNRIWVSIERPVLYQVAIDFENTDIGGVVTSFFGWGAVEMTPYEMNELQRQAIVEMELLAHQELIVTAHEYTETAVTELIFAVLAAAGVSGYRVEIKWL